MAAPDYEELYKQLTAAYNSRDVGKIMEFYSDDVKHTDYLTGHLNWTKPQVTEYIKYFFSQINDIEFKTTRVIGSGEFVTWELDMPFVPTESIEALGFVKGEGSLIRGAAVMRWVDGKIVEEVDYFMVIDQAKLVGGA
ncbi:hypothetical protein PT974_01102 [Cladobotryum mycophilum]|uniref:SnoaL-like domain-containing protein n=1 Tax=Cladobotryum mycophilum TaxID=491253 RepID=A0ABR0T3Y3_9HYPO